MSAPDTSPCQNWSPSEVCFHPPEGATEELQDFALQVATEILWRRSGRRYGLCAVTLRPCKRDCLPAGPWIPQLGSMSPSASWPFPALVGGVWINIACGCRTGCSCTRVEEVVLPYPVAQVDEVLIDGMALDPLAYRVDEWSRLVRVDGGTWPRCNDLSKNATEVGTWSVTASYGEVVPSSGSLAVGELATEIMKSCLNLDCKIPAAATSISRQGVNIDLLDASFGKNIGLRWSDLFIATVNPSRSQPATIIDIDGQAPVRTNT